MAATESVVSFVPLSDTKSPSKDHLFYSYSKTIIKMNKSTTVNGEKLGPQQRMFNEVVKLFPCSDPDMLSEENSALSFNRLVMMKVQNPFNVREYWATGFNHWIKTYLESEHRCFYELIPSPSPNAFAKIAIDMDLKWEYNTHFFERIGVPDVQALSQQARTTLYARITKQVVDETKTMLLDAVQTHLGVQRDMVKLYECDSSTESKFSRHIVLELWKRTDSGELGVVPFLGFVHQRNFIQMYLCRPMLHCAQCDAVFTDPAKCAQCGNTDIPLGAIFRDENQSMDCVVDRSIYTANRVVRCIGSRKLKDLNNPLRSLSVLDADGERINTPITRKQMEQFWITYIPPDTPIAGYFASTLDPLDRVLTSAKRQRRRSSVSRTASKRSKPGSPGFSGFPRFARKKYALSGAPDLIQPIIEFIKTKDPMVNSVLVSENEDNGHCTLLFSSDSRACSMLQAATDGKQHSHENNHIYWVVHPCAGTYRQKCYSTTRNPCAEGGANKPMPEDIMLPSVKELCSSWMDTDTMYGLPIPPPITMHTEQPSTGNWLNILLAPYL